MKAVERITKPVEAAITKHVRAAQNNKTGMCGKYAILFAIVKRLMPGALQRIIHRDVKKRHFH